MLGERVSGMTPMILTWADFDLAVESLLHRIGTDASDLNGVYGVPRGGLVLAVALSHRLGLPLLDAPQNRSLIVDDIVDSGKTMERFNGVSALRVAWVVRPEWRDSYRHVRIASADRWLIFPWEDQSAWEKEAQNYAAAR